ncbi:lipoprotein-releasing ABC transporter permease subunit LolE [Shewanella sp. NIFS-20-20]|uniref:lipoprotein-releasing ABC transporter permease subunit LolE n=1 Tax=Shewanella sp. NIFS-20-20 TaxID=2853806 RepID=UPI001C457DA6|nr:lipoprotein-releasing ABC transporter permease subunit LolE [Shewanella sp. NIFS-20-20]MBV7315517.1 lipoprotein-releasing ABC transporter permease subunit LolE [Shewanella sp. NIFS-20-20]
MKAMLGLTIGWRFYRARQANGFIGFISMASTVGIALGVAVLIVLLSAMNGFEQALEDKFLAVVPQAELVGAETPIANWRQMMTEASQISGIAASAPFVRIQGLIQKQGGFQGVDLAGIDTQYEAEVSAIKHYMSAATWQALSVDTNHIVLGHSLLERLGLKVGDSVSLYIPNQDGQGLAKARSLRFVVAGSFNFGGEIEQNLGYIPMAYAQQVMNLGDSVSGVRIRTHDVFAAPALIRQLGYQQTQYLYLSDWTRTQGHLYQDIQLVRMLMYLVLALVIAVACFNIVSTLVMAVRDKTSEIAILMTMGCYRWQIMSIFMVQGLMSGVMGTVIGGVAGIILALNLSDLASGIESLLGMKLLDSDIYFIDSLPSQLQWSDVNLVVCLALVMSFIATLYPAWRASKVLPASALNG